MKHEVLVSRMGLGFIALALALGLGIVIGTIVSDEVSNASQVGPAELRVEGTGNPVVLDSEVNLSEGFSKVAKTVGSAVVNISTQSIVQRRQMIPEGSPFRQFLPDLERQLPDEQKLTSLGTGIIVDSVGYIITNHHVVSRADRVTVRLSSGQNYLAEVLGSDEYTDLAVIKINAGTPLPFAKVGDSSNTQVGDWVLAIGSPFGLDQTVSAGIVSATSRVGVTTAGGQIVPFQNIFGDYLQTDAAINPGNSGGPLVNMKGEVIGVNTFIVTRGGGSQGVGFSIPSSVFVNAYNQLVATGMIERGWLGVTMNQRPLTPELSEFFGLDGEDPNGVKDGDGVLIVDLVDEQGKSSETGPAYRAGIRPEDVIVRFGSLEVETNYDLRAAVANTLPGEEVPAVVVRKGQVLDFRVKLAKRTFEERSSEDNRTRSFEEAKPEREKEIGLEFRTLDPREAEQAGLSGLKGVLIEEVRVGSLADEAGLASGQVISSVNGEAVEDANTFERKIRAMASGTAIILRIEYVGPNRQPVIEYSSFRKP